MGILRLRRVISMQEKQPLQSPTLYADVVLGQLRSIHIGLRGKCLALKRSVYSLVQIKPGLRNVTIQEMSTRSDL